MPEEYYGFGERQAKCLKKIMDLAKGTIVRSEPCVLHFKNVSACSKEIGTSENLGKRTSTRREAHSTRTKIRSSPEAPFYANKVKVEGEGLEK
jgi:hypothetical protein